jgi:hypothetical protein
MKIPDVDIIFEVLYYIPSILKVIKNTAFKFLALTLFEIILR